MKAAKGRLWLLAFGLAVALVASFAPFLGTAHAKVSTCHDCDNVCTNVGDWGCCVEFPGHGCMAWGVCL